MTAFQCSHLPLYKSPGVKIRLENVPPCLNQIIYRSLDHNALPFASSFAFRIPTSPESTSTPQHPVPPGIIITESVAKPLPGWSPDLMSITSCARFPLAHQLGNQDISNNNS